MLATPLSRICKFSTSNFYHRPTHKFISRAQGAAQAVEVGAVLGHLFEKMTHKNQLTDLLVIYEAIRKSRTTRVVKGSTAYRDIYHMHDGPRQVERDRQLLEYEPFEGYPNRWADPVFQKFLFDYDAQEEVEKAWETYVRKISHDGGRMEIAGQLVSL